MHGYSCEMTFMDRDTTYESCLAPCLPTNLCRVTLSTQASFDQGKRGSESFFSKCLAWLYITGSHSIVEKCDTVTSVHRFLLSVRVAV